MEKMAQQAGMFCRLSGYTLFVHLTVYTLYNSDFVHVSTHLLVHHLLI